MSPPRDPFDWSPSDIDVARELLGVDPAVPDSAVAAALIAMDEDEMIYDSSKLVKPTKAKTKEQRAERAKVLPKKRSKRRR